MGLREQESFYSCVSFYCVRCVFEARVVSSVFSRVVVNYSSLRSQSLGSVFVHSKVSFNYSLEVINYFPSEVTNYFPSEVINYFPSEVINYFPSEVSTISRRKLSTISRRKLSTISRRKFSTCWIVSVVFVFNRELCLSHSSNVFITLVKCVYHTCHKHSRKICCQGRADVQTKQ